jgi:hypothetical protein
MALQRLRWALQMVGAWLHHSPMLALVHHRSNSAAPEFLKMVAHNFVAHLPLGRGRTFSYNPSSFIFSSPAQEVVPLTNLLSLQEKVSIFHLKGANSSRPLRSLLSHLHLCSCLASYIQIQGKSQVGDASGFLEFPVSKR